MLTHLSTTFCPSQFSLTMDWTLGRRPTDPVSQSSVSLAPRKAYRYLLTYSLCLPSAFKWTDSGRAGRMSNSYCLCDKLDLMVREDALVRWWIVFVCEPRRHCEIVLAIFFFFLLCNMFFSMLCVSYLWMNSVHCKSSYIYGQRFPIHSQCSDFIYYYFFFGISGWCNMIYSSNKQKSKKSLQYKCLKTKHLSGPTLALRYLWAMRQSCIKMTEKKTDSVLNKTTGRLIQRNKMC